MKAVHKCTWRIAKMPIPALKQNHLSMAWHKAMAVISNDKLVESPSAISKVPVKTDYRNTIWSSPSHIRGHIVWLIFGGFL